MRAIRSRGQHGRAGRLRHGIDPFEYLRDLIERLPTHPVERMAELTPRAWKLERARALAAARA